MHMEAIMKTITIHGVDDQLAAHLKRLAESEGTSLNRTGRRLLEEAVGMKPRPQGRYRDQFEAFCGVWSEDELSAFRRATADFEHVDEGDWS